MNKLFLNTKQEPKIYYCRHIAPGVCGYNDETIFIGEECLKNMDKTFAGKPLYVEHQQVDLEHLRETADGYVIESFYLPEDGSHWAKIIVVSDKGHEAVNKGWAVSNAYMPDNFGGEGEWHNIPYNREITDAHYTHLAIVENPRYEEATIMTPEEFKQYKSSKKEQLNQLQNSKQGVKTMFKLFTKKEVTNSEDISKAMVELSNGKTISIQEMINAVEEDIKAKEAAKNKKNAEEELLEKVVKVNGEDVSVKELIQCYESAKKNADEDKDKENEDEEKDEKKSKKNKCNEDKEDEEKKDKKNEDEDKDEEENEDEEDKEKKDKKNEEDEDKKEKKDKKNSKDFIDILKKAEELANAKESNGTVADTMSIKLARGTQRYGSAQ